jgi:hypothetical protein
MVVKAAWKYCHTDWMKFELSFPIFFSIAEVNFNFLIWVCSFSKVIVTVYCDIIDVETSPYPRWRAGNYAFCYIKKVAKRTDTGRSQRHVLSFVIIDRPNSSCFVFVKMQLCTSKLECGEIVQCTMWFSEHLNKISVVLNEGRVSLNYCFPEKNDTRCLLKVNILLEFFTAWLSLK